MNFIDISGVGNSGKGALVDFLREIDGYYVPEYWFEFDIIRVSGGLLDFRHCLLEDWSPVRSDAAYHEFIDVTNKMGLDPALFNIIGLIKSTGQRYDRRFDGQFRALSHEFANHFKIGSYKAEWGFAGLRENGFAQLIRRIARRVGFRRSMLDKVVLMDGQDFDKIAKSYVEDLYRLFIPTNCDNVVLNNGFEPFNPEPGLRMLGARQIVVNRDPRDIYISGLNSHNINHMDKSLLAFDNDGLSKAFLATDDLETFVKRYRLYQDQLFKGSRKDVLHVKFEELILDYVAQKKLILDFLDINPSQHIRPNSFFKPRDSVKNVGLWRNSARKNEIGFIETNLSEFLFEQ